MTTVDQARCYIAAELLCKVVFETAGHSATPKIDPARWAAQFSDHDALANLVRSYPLEGGTVFSKNRLTLDQVLSIQAQMLPWLSRIVNWKEMKAILLIQQFDSVMGSDSAEVLLFESLTEDVGQSLVETRWLAA